MKLSRRNLLTGAAVLAGSSAAQAAKLLVPPAKKGAAAVPAAPAANAPVAASAPQPFAPSAQPAPAAEPFRVKMDQWRDLDYKYQKRQMAYASDKPPGTIVVDPHDCFLYYILGGGQAIRYGVSVGKSAKAWTGEVVIEKMAVWPIWVPAPYHLEEIPSLVKWIHGMPGGPDNPLGARAMYLFANGQDTQYRIHGTNEPSSIGHAMSSGCIRMLNEYVADLFDRTTVGTHVRVLASQQNTASFFQ